MRRWAPSRRTDLNLNTAILYHRHRRLLSTLWVFVATPRDNSPRFALFSDCTSPCESGTKVALQLQLRVQVNVQKMLLEELGGSVRPLPSQRPGTVNAGGDVGVTKGAVGRDRSSMFRRARTAGTVSVAQRTGTHPQHVSTSASGAQDSNNLRAAIFRRLVLCGHSLFVTSRGMLAWI
jgi:hypothetical protein